MTILVVSATAPSGRVKGLLRRYLLEADSGLFCGKISSRLAKELVRALEGISDVRATIVYTAKCESQFAVRVIGDSERMVVDNYGLPLVGRRVVEKNR